MTILRRGDAVGAPRRLEPAEVRPKAVVSSCRAEARGRSAFGKRAVVSSILTGGSDFVRALFDRLQIRFGHILGVIEALDRLHALGIDPGATPNRQRSPNGSEQQPGSTSD